MFQAEMNVPDVNVFTSNDGGHTNEQLVELALDKLLYISVFFFF